jgi:hypothetical protein
MAPRPWLWPARCVQTSCEALAMAVCPLKRIAGHSVSHGSIGHVSNLAHMAPAPFARVLVRTTASLCFRITSARLVLFGSCLFRFNHNSDFRSLALKSLCNPRSQGYRNHRRSCGGGIFRRPSRGNYGGRGSILGRGVALGSSLVRFSEGLNPCPLPG